jgi:bud site selection protein 31
MPPRRSNKPPPPGYEIIEPVIEALENELRDKVKESNVNKRNTESIWPVHQINWQRTRYVYDMYYTYHRISKQVYDYCLKHKLIDAGLIAKWKKPGYERLCSTYVINPANYKFGTTSICRVPMKDRPENAKNAQDPTTGCLGCASGKDAGPRNIFGNKYGQNLAAVQIAREKRREALEEKKKKKRQVIENVPQEEEEEEEEEEGEEEVEEQRRLEENDNKNNNSNENYDKGDGESETEDEEETDDDDEDDDDDFGPSPAAGVWAGSKKLEAESEDIAQAAGKEKDEESGASVMESTNGERPNKKPRAA